MFQAKLEDSAKIRTNEGRTLAAAALGLASLLAFSWDIKACDLHRSKFTYRVELEQADDFQP